MIQGDADRTVPIAASGLRPALANLQAMIREGAVKRLRPKFMSVATMFVGLIPSMWATGRVGPVEANRRADGWAASLP
jgi:Cu/Ag efflux pump CusA